MTQPSVKIKKIWVDDNDSFFELSLDFWTGRCSMNLNIFTDNEELEKLNEGVMDLANFKQKEFLWITGEDVENVSHFLSMRFFLCGNRGYVGVEVTADNKLESPYSVRATFFLVTVLSQIDDLTRKLGSFIKGEICELESLIRFFE
ncbi:hypothetical protein ACFFJI_09350 [Allobacillus sp. GCM10007491]|uniref:Uncharacterized protein n=2 Tax=Allobacillus TaxID=1400133 RepID=A0A941HTT6_9BACI|nr:MULTISPECIES: hypothetical protein [Allobacillus]MBR7554738.1 hypothetical protein [Allobacillus saliphilus]TSJ60711.1 hypothetical protein FPQ13_12030 [Allobacillus salarius]